MGNIKIPERADKCFLIAVVSIFPTDLNSIITRPYAAVVVRLFRLIRLIRRDDTLRTIRIAGTQCRDYA